MQAHVRESVGREANTFREGKSAFQEETMSNSRYYVVGNNDVWMIQSNDAENGQYKSSKEAALFAIAAAQKLGMRGECSHVCMLDDDGRLQRKWSHNQALHLNRSPFDSSAQVPSCFN
jgi:hypothetical protein